MHLTLALAALAGDPSGDPILQVDLHLDTPTQLHRKGGGLDGKGLEAGVDQLRAGGTNVAVQVLWPPQKANWEAHSRHLFDIVEREDSSRVDVELVRSPEQARIAVRAGRTALLVSMEGAHGLDVSGVAGLRELHGRGLTMLGLTWSFSNRFAGSSGDAGGGVTPEGWPLVVEANRLGVVLDVSHASDLATMEVCGWSHAPVVASHSNADGVRAHARNLSDEAIRCIAHTGGVIGVNFHKEFVGGGRDVAGVADHADYLRRIGGVGVVALGSDFDGLIQPATGLETAAKVPALWDELRRRGWSEPDITAARGGNFMRAWERVQTIGRALRGEVAG